MRLRQVGAVKFTYDIWKPIYYFFFWGGGGFQAKKENLKEITNKV